MITLNGKSYKVSLSISDMTFNNEEISNANINLATDDNSDVISILASSTHNDPDIDVFIEEIHQSITKLIESRG